MAHFRKVLYHFQVVLVVTEHLVIIKYCVTGRCLQGRKITVYGFGYHSAYEIKERRNLTSAAVLSKLSPNSGCTGAGKTSCTWFRYVRSPCSGCSMKADVTVLGVFWAHQHSSGGNGHWKKLHVCGWVGYYKQSEDFWFRSCSASVL